MGRIIDFIGHLSSQENNRKKIILAEKCKTGSAIAMYEMAYVMRSQCDREENKLLKRYEEEPSQENTEKISTRKNLSLMAEAYMMWIVRAALYGSRDAAELLEKCPLYKRMAYIPYDMVAENTGNIITIWNSTTLYDMGFIDVPRDYTDCRLTYDKDKKIYDLCYVSYYEPPDEDGFGAEWEYNDIYFDEFFCRLSKNLNLQK